MPLLSPAIVRNAAYLAVWLLGTSLGFAKLLAYSSSSGETGEPVLSWPADSPLERSESNSELLFFAHALCPCTHASLRELERSLAHAPADLRCRVIIWSDPEQQDLFSESTIRKRALQLLDVDVVDDPNGLIADLFGVRTSGHSLFYSAQGSLLFSGGITPARGHEGSNLGSQSLRQLWSEGFTDSERSEVFGCPLVEPTS